METHASIRGAILLFLATSCAAPATRPAEHDAATFYATTSYQGVSFSHDGKSLLASSDESGVYNAYAFDLASRKWTQLTHSTSAAVATIGWFPHDRRFLTTSDQGGNELNHLYAGDESGARLDLTPGEKLKAQFLGWAGDGQSLFAMTNERDPQYFDVYRIHFGAQLPGNALAIPGAPGFARELLFENSGGFDVGGVSKDGARIALDKLANNSNSDVYLARVGSLDPPLLVTPHSGEAVYAFMDFSSDGGTLFYRTNGAGEFDTIWAYDVATGDRKQTLAAEWDVTRYEFSDDGHWLTTAVNADARTVLRVFEAATGKEIALPKLPAGDVTDVAFEPRGMRMACYVNGDTSPSNLHLVDLATGKSEQVTRALTPEIRESELVEAEVVRFPSFDGLAIPALVYRPHGASAERRAPAVIWVHGGPGGQSRRGYNASLQHLVNHGYAVLAINNRGSSGYGKTFFHLDDRRHGDVDLQDCVYARRWLESRDWVDGKRVGIMGGSYGGYMVCAALAFTPDAFDCGIDIFGVTNWIRTLESIPPWWSSARDSLYAEIGDPAADRERLVRRSPLVHAKEIRKPMLVIQGKNDPRVLEAESREIAAAVRANGVHVEYVLFEDEGHGFRNKANRIRASDAYVAFLDAQLRGMAAK